MLYNDAHDMVGEDSENMHCLQGSGFKEEKTTRPASRHSRWFSSFQTPTGIRTCVACRGMVSASIILLLVTITMSIISLLLGFLNDEA